MGRWAASASYLGPSHSWRLLPVSTPGHTGLVGESSRSEQVVVSTGAGSRAASGCTRAERVFPRRCLSLAYLPGRLSALPWPAPESYSLSLSRVSTNTVSARARALVKAEILGQKCSTAGRALQLVSKSRIPDAIATWMTFLIERASFGPACPKPLTSSPCAKI